MTVTKGSLKNEFALPQTLSRLFQLIQFVKCWQIFLELNSKRLYQSSGKEKESCCLVFTSSTKREIWHFHVVVVQRRQRNVQKKHDSWVKLLFNQSEPIAFSRSCCRRRRRCLSSLLLIFTTTATTTTIPLSATPALAAIIIIRTLRSEDCDGEENVA